MERFLGGVWMVVHTWRWGLLVLGRCCFSSVKVKCVVVVVVIIVVTAVDLALHVHCDYTKLVQLFI